MNAGTTMSSEDLREYLERIGVNARFFRFQGHTMTVDAAVSRLGVNRGKIIKTMVFVDEIGLPILAIVTGEMRVSEKKLAAVCEARKVKRANSAQVKEFTGYDVGGVPPVGHKTQIRTFIDEKIMTLGKVIGGGGEINQLLEISPVEIKRLTKGQVKEISES